jgi:hypothetical protein
MGLNDSDNISDELMRRRRGMARETDEQIKQRIGWSLYYRWRFTGRRPDGTMDPAFKPFDPLSRPRGTSRRLQPLVDGSS